MSTCVSNSTALTLIVPGDPDQRTGGYLYDAQIAAGLKALGRSVEVIGLDGAFPVADTLAHQAMDEALSRARDGHCVVIDGLALGGVPESVEPHADRLALVGLVHHPLADETGLGDKHQQALLRSEHAALSLCRAIIVTSPFTRRRLHELGLVEDQPIFVVEPGVAPAGLSRRVEQRWSGTAADDTARLLCVASLTPRKGQDLLIEALNDLRDRHWTLDLVGSADRNPDFARALGDRIKEKDLESRVRLVGEVDGERLATFYDQSDLCLLPSWYEGYGMVATEALARGLPLITTTGGALSETVPRESAVRVPPGDVQALRQALDRWLSDPDLRTDLSRAAANQRSNLLDWPAATRQFAAALDSTMGDRG